jgi:hypothetical protein
MKDVIQTVDLVWEIIREGKDSSMEKSYLPSLYNNLALLATSKKDYQAAESYVLGGSAVADK